VTGVQTCALPIYQLSLGEPIDASGQLVDGTQVDGVVALRQALVREPQMFARTVAEKLLTYAVGRGLSAADMPVVRTVVRDAAPHQYRFSALVLGIVKSAPFQMRITAGEPVTPQIAAQ